jgi:hypothetical protein
MALLTFQFLSPPFLEFKAGMFLLLYSFCSRQGSAFFMEK